MTAMRIYQREDDMNKNIRYIIITALICPAAAFSINAITSTHDAQQAQNGFLPQPGNWTASPGYWAACPQGGSPSVMHFTQSVAVYTDPSADIAYFFAGASKPTAAQVKEDCP